MIHAGLPADGKSYEIRGLVADPKDADRIHLCTNQGVYLSVDGGIRWKQVLEAAFWGNGWYRGEGRVLVRDPDHPALLYAASIGDGVFRSSDAGESWIKLGPEKVMPSDLCIDRSSPKRLWLCARPYKDWKWKEAKIELKSGLYRSLDGGNSWELLSESTPSEIVQDPHDAGILWGIVRKKQIVQSRDAGQSWAPFTAGLPPYPEKDSAGADGIFEALCAGPDFMLAGSHGGWMYKLEKDSKSWKRIVCDRVDESGWWGAMGEGRYKHFGNALSFVAVSPHDPKHWVFTDWYSLYQSWNEGRNWKLTTDGVEMTVVHVVQQDPWRPEVVHAGVADVGYFRSEDGGASYAQIKNGISSNVKYISPCLAKRDRLYATGTSTWEWMSNQVFRSDDGGRSWKRSAMKGLPDMKRERCNTVVAHPQKEDVAYLAVSGPIEPGGGGVYESTDAGETWAWVGAGLPKVGHFFRKEIWVSGPELAVDSKGQLLANSCDTGRTFRFDTPSGRWEEIRAGEGGGVNALAADIHTAGRFFAARKEGGLWRTDDGGLTWKQLVERDIWSVACDLVKPGRVAANGQGQLLVSEDAGDTWRAAPQTLPYRHARNVPAFSGDRLQLGTGGNGVFFLPLEELHGDPKAYATGRVLAPGVSASTDIALLRNGDLSEGAEEPKDWSLGSTRSGNIRMIRDRTVFKSTPAALRLDTQGESGSGFAQQRLSPTPEGKVRATGSVRAEGTFDVAQVVVQAFDGQWKQVDWKVLARIEPRGTWTDFDTTFELSPRTRHALFGLLVKGNGKAWLDDAKVRPAEASGVSIRPTTFAKADPLPVRIDASEIGLRYSGRFDATDPSKPRAAWPASAVTVRFSGRDLNAQLFEEGSNRYEVVLDGQSTGVLVPTRGEGRYALARGLPEGEHVISLVKRTEASFGAFRFMGFEANAGAHVLPMPPIERRIEIFGDSISAGYGNEATSEKESFSAETQNAWLTYGAQAARRVGADFTCIAWSGRKMAGSDGISSIAFDTIPLEPKVAWAFTKPAPDAVVIALSGNDFREDIPDEQTWTAAYLGFISRLREKYPNAYIYLGPSVIMNDQYVKGEAKPRATLMRYLAAIVTARKTSGDARVAVIAWPSQRREDGIGANWHPSVATHRRMSAMLVEALERDLGWAAAAPEASQGQNATDGLPVEVPHGHERLTYIGRFDTRDPAGPRAAWSLSEVTFKFRGTAANAWFSTDKDTRLQVVVDGQPRSVLALKSGRHRYGLASDLPLGEHVVAVIKRTEPIFGTWQIHGFELSTGAELLPLLRKERRIEFLGDSITCGYGNEAKNQHEKFSAATENAYLGYGALAARSLDAEATIIAWSGKCLWPRNSLSELWDRTLPLDAGSAFSFDARPPHAVVINLGTNDFAGGNPEESGWVGAYHAFIGSIRARYPETLIVCAIGPMMSDPFSPSKNALTTIKRYLSRVVAEQIARGDSRVRMLVFETQKGENGFGADWHPSLKTHELMADRLCAFLKAELRL
ncbi:MAG: hypothetical protein AMXMBFR7_39340 [Planctomycetota bacterium]